MRILNSPYHPIQIRSYWIGVTTKKRPEQGAVIARPGRRERDELPERQERDQAEQQDRYRPRPWSPRSRRPAITHQARIRALMLSTVARCGCGQLTAAQNPADDRRDDQQRQDAAEQSAAGRRSSPRVMIRSLSSTQAVRALARNASLGSLRPVAAADQTSRRLSIGTGRVSPFGRIRFRFSRWTGISSASGRAVRDGTGRS